MRVLCLSSYPVESAATRFRVAQFVGPLREYGIELELSPFLDSGQFGRMYSRGGGLSKAAGVVGPLLKRFGEVFMSRRYDLIFLQREAMFFGPGIFEWMYQNVGKVPMILDLDDATYIPYLSPSYGRVGSFFKFFGKTDNLIKRAKLVTCGNRFIADYAMSKGAEVVVIPTVVDTELFRPAEKANEIPVIGWIGTHSTFPFLETLFPVLERLAKSHRFKLRIVGAGKKRINIDGVDVENLDWIMDREIADFQSLDIGLYPITLSNTAKEQWILGKSGFKAIQYLAVGVPFVMSPVGVCADIGVPAATHFNAVSDEDWYNFIELLLLDAKLRTRMGEAGRRHSLGNYALSKQADLLANAFRQTIGRN